jgi:hypothetical protein
VQDDDLMRSGGQTEDINTGKEVINNMEVDGFAKGGELTDERKKEVREKWVKLVNMPPSELKRFYNSEEGKEAGLSPSEAKSQGIDSGRESARWILRMKETPVKDWTPEMWRWAGKQINFINRMSGNKGPLYKDGEKTRKHTSLLIWGHNPNKKAAGDLIETKSNSYMTGVQYNELPSVKTVERGQQIVLKDTVMTKQYGLHTLYYLVEVVSKSTMSGFYVLRVIKNLSHQATNAGRIITRSADNILTYGREVQKGVSEAIGLKRGGELNPDDTKVKKYFSHNSGAAGGVLVGKRHSEGGIKGINKSTGQPLEVEGGEVVITRDAVSDTTKREFMGKQMTNREILSQINQSGGGVAFADGGETGDISCRCSGREYSYGGKTMKDRDILSEMNALYKGMAIEDKEHGDTFKMLESGKLKYKDFLKRLVSDHLKENPNYYDKYKG